MLNYYHPEHHWSNFIGNLFSKRFFKTQTSAKINFRPRYTESLTTYDFITEAAVFSCRHKMLPEGFPFHQFNSKTKLYVQALAILPKSINWLINMMKCQQHRSIGVHLKKDDMCNTQCYDWHKNSNLDVVDPD